MLSAVFDLLGPTLSFFSIEPPPMILPSASFHPRGRLPIHPSRLLPRPLLLPLNPSINTTGTETNNPLSKMAVFDEPERGDEIVDDNPTRRDGEEDKVRLRSNYMGQWSEVGCRELGRVDGTGRLDYGNGASELGGVLMEWFTGRVDYEIGALEWATRGVGWLEGKSNGLESTCIDMWLDFIWIGFQVDSSMLG
ncbi:hypothetical protein Salat_1485100 [Sesamum alatum]|uniref:Uncharacterized protein n=1 Tax=Sesamum alatum TaxID=300844 RepID=A0AAE1YBM9_9LAMI|nr:hypothetical protein Salat_1485100 [Sesamum alatum]